MKPNQNTTIRFDEKEVSLLKSEARRTQQSISSVVRKAVREYFSEEETYWDTLFRRLSRNRDELRDVQNRQNILTEVFLLFTKYFFAVSPPIPPEALEDAKHHGVMRYEAFLKAFEKTLSEGGILHQVLHDIEGSLHVSQEDQEEQ
jgi:hypothetical protein